MPQAGINYNEEEMEKAMKPFSEMFNKEDKPQVSEPIAKQEDPKSSIFWALVHALDHCNEVSKTERSRELSLVITKIEEAQMWYEKIYPNKGL